jgi:hypothetical protein
MLTDEQIEAEMVHARSWAKRPGWVAQSGECEGLADLAVALEARLRDEASQKRIAQDLAEKWKALAMRMERARDARRALYARLRERLRAAEAELDDGCGCDACSRRA